MLRMRPARSVMPVTPPVAWRTNRSIPVSAVKVVLHRGLEPTEMSISSDDTVPNASTCSCQHHLRCTCAEIS